METLPRLKIWYLLPTLDLGGSEKHVIHLASGLRQRGHEAGVACICEEGVLAGEVRKRRIPFDCLETGGQWGIPTFFRLSEWLRSHPTDILHTYLFGFHLFAGLPARLAKFPVILSSRRDVDLAQKTWHLWLENAGNLFVDRVVSCSKAVEKWVLGREFLGREKVTTIYNGVDLERFTGAADRPGIRKEFGIPEDAALVGTIANFSFKKGYRHLLESARLILASEPRTWFLLVGSGPLEEEMKEAAKQIPHSDQIVFVGARTDIADLLAAMDLFVLASLWEGLPNVLLEAMAMGKPVVATEVGGASELIQPGTEGVLVPAGNDAALAEAVLVLLKNPAKAEAMGRRAQEKIRRQFTMERMIDDYEALYFSLCRQKGLGKEQGAGALPRPESVLAPPR